MIGYGTSVYWDGASPKDAKKLADALDGVRQTGSRSLWQYPDGGISKGPSRQFGNITLEYVSVYWDGRSLWLDMVGPGALKDVSGLSSFLNSINVRISGQSHMVSGKPL